MSDSHWLGKVKRCRVAFYSRDSRKKQKEIIDKYCKYCDASFPKDGDHWYFTAGESKCKKKSAEYAKREEVKAKNLSINLTEKQKESKKAQQKEARERRKLNPNYKEKRRTEQRKYKKTTKYKIRAPIWSKNGLKKKEEWHKNKLKIDPTYRIITNIRSRLNKIIKSKDRKQRSRDLFGADLEVVRDHLESKFMEGMSWDNYGEWHIDHIIPISTFDFSVESEIIRACHYTNLQPLWAKDNLRKRDKIIPEGFYLDENFELVKIIYTKK